MISAWSLLGLPLCLILGGIIGYLWGMRAGFDAHNMVRRIVQCMIHELDAARVFQIADFIASKEKKVEQDEKENGVPDTESTPATS